MSSQRKSHWTRRIIRRLESAEKLTRALIQTLAKMFVGFLLIIFVINLLWRPFRAEQNSVEANTQVASVTKDIDRIKAHLAQLDAELQKTQQNINGIKANPEALNSLQLKTLSTDISDSKDKLTNIEKVLLDNPSKALDMPLLHRDMDNLKSNYQVELASTRQEVDRVYDQNKWFLGVMITTLLAVIGLIGSSILKKPPLGS